MLRRALLGLAAVMLIGCGGNSSPAAPQAAATLAPTPTPPPPRGVPLSAVTMAPIPNGSITPELSDMLPADQLIEIRAPDHYTLRTTAGHLRAKGNRIYLIPLSFDREYFQAVYYHSIFRIYSIPIYQWGRNPIRFQADSLLLSDSAAMRSISTAIASVNAILERVDTPLRLMLGGGSAADFLMQISPTLLTSDPINLYSSLGPPERGTSNRAGGVRVFFQGQILFRDVQTAAQTNLFRHFFRLVSPAGFVSPGRGFLSSADYEAFEAPNEEEIAITRAYLNRCGGGQLLGVYGNGTEDDRVVTPCVTPPSGATQ
jgi:hypothetical protein